MAKTGGGLEPPIVIQGLDDALRAYMAKLGAKGGKISGALRLDSPSEKRRKEIARRGAAARWAKKTP